MRALAARLPADPGSGPVPRVVVNAVHPGMCITDIFAKFPLPVRALIRGAQRLVAYTADEGARFLVWAAVGDAAALRGQYIGGGRPQESSDFVLSERGQRAQESLWAEVLDILGDVDPKVLSIVREYLEEPKQHA
ncbi:Retinol dehydrogenase 12 [Mycena indigotica]|nr:Retinol dehydrogenase 12 [Mycena indigotica]KAF7304038.1 Retinol dehydrogenase 12 [Mycena indigotica]